MIIYKIIIGNNSEAFIEEGLDEGINIISSDDNNKGKTIVIQSLMYCLGNNPVFPATFDYKDYYFIVEFSIRGNIFILCRKNNEFVIKTGNAIQILDSVSDFKRYWNKNISKLPSIIKNGLQRIVDPELFLQMFFIGQDKKDTSNISNKAFYNKEDFINMVLSFGNESIQFDYTDIEKYKKKISELEFEKRTILKHNKILKSTNKAISLISSSGDRYEIEKKISELNGKRERLVELKKERNRQLARINKYKTALKELNSLNRSINAGELICLDCQSSHIGYESASDSYIFDVSTTEIRKQIINSINDKITAYREEFEKTTDLINNLQFEMNEILKEDEVSIENLLLIKPEYIDSAESDLRLTKIDKEIFDLKHMIEKSKENDITNKEKNKVLLDRILDSMKSAYEYVDPVGGLELNELFSRRDKVYSGSEATEFYIVKLFALAKVLEHEYPVVIDSFRAEDLSTMKEKRVIELFKKLNNQVILSTTLKTEELGKYDQWEEVNHIDYIQNTPYKILSEKHIEEFYRYLNKLYIDKIVAK